MGSPLARVYESNAPLIHALLKSSGLMDLCAVTHEVNGEMILRSYRRGIFPMGNAGLITWHRPPRRALIPLDSFHVSRSLARTIRLARFRVTYDHAFESVMRACADRPDDDGTWITEPIVHAYCDLHRRGSAHSVEVWVDNALAGGVYGVHIGGAFFAESKFHRVRDMSKVALAHLAWRLRERGFALLEVQYLTEHLARFGTVEISGSAYRRILERALLLDCSFA